jgi:hypothetical protein
MKYAVCLAANSGTKLQKLVFIDAGEGDAAWRNFQW